MGEKEEDRSQESGARSSNTKSRTSKAQPQTGRLVEGKMIVNKVRERFVNRELRKQGWRVVRIWEHERTKNAQRCVSRIRTLFGHR